MDKNIIFGIGAAIGGFVLGVITNRMTTKDTIDKATKSVEETTEYIVEARGAVNSAQKVIDDQNHIIDLLNSTIMKQAEELEKYDNNEFKKWNHQFRSEFSDFLKEKREKEQKEKSEAEVKQAIKEKDWKTVYNKAERWYNKYPVQMSRSEVFTNLEKDGYITQEERTEAYNYFGSLWNYVGD